MHVCASALVFMWVCQFGGFSFRTLFVSGAAQYSVSRSGNFRVGLVRCCCALVNVGVVCMCVHRHLFSCGCANLAGFLFELCSCQVLPSIPFQGPEISGLGWIDVVVP